VLSLLLWNDCRFDSMLAWQTGLIVSGSEKYCTTSYDFYIIFFFSFFDLEAERFLVV